MKTMDFVYLAGGAVLGYFAYTMLTNKDGQSNFTDTRYGQNVRGEMCKRDHEGREWSSTACGAYEGKGLM
jgi:hypothetical protein